MRTAAKSILTKPFNNSDQIPSLRQSLHQLNRWLGVSVAAERTWAARLPAVCVASVCLALYAWFTGLPPVRVEWLIIVSLAVLAVGIVSD